MKSTFNVLFYLRKNRLNKERKSDIMVRITVNGKMVQFNSKLDVDPKLWDPKMGKATGKTIQAIKLNSSLDNIKAIIIQHHREISNKELDVTAEKVKNAFLGIHIKEETLMSLFQKQIEDLKIQEGKGVSKDSIQKYERTRDRLKIFMLSKYNISDINIKEINHTFICDFEIHLRVTYDCVNNTATKYIQRFKSIILRAINNGLIHANPFANYKIRFEKFDRGYLTQEEIERIMAKEFPVKRLEHVRDIFIFSCFTGLAYVDVRELQKDNIRTSFDGNLWIMGKRGKTRIPYNVPLLEIPKMILDKYKDKSPNGFLLPVLSNQKTNTYLKEIADICEISKNLTFHLARHTFATLTLTKGVSIESVSKMLGHTNINTTQIYARITNQKISQDMKEFAGKIKGIENIR